jgi:hypothetical protein
MYKKLRKSITEIAKEVIKENPHYIVVGELTKFAKKYNVEATDIFQEMIRLQQPISVSELPQKGGKG